MSSGLFKFGLVGSVITALCCFTPLLVWLLGAVGLGGWVAGLDAVLLPLLLVFVLITVYALVTRRRRAP